MKNKYEKTYVDLKERLRQYLADQISSTDLKHASAPLGIYQQRNELFMMRIRIAGGQLSVDQLKAIPEIMDTYNVGFAHITSRQDLQLQDVAPLAIYPILRKLTEQGLPFKGGGGNTFRNILVSSDSGVSRNEVFDVYPYADALNKYLLKQQKAFELPRKFKIGFSSGKDDSIKAIMQDLGFIATKKKKRKGFEVYAGGGMGKKSMVGIKLIDFLTERQFAKCAKAMLNLFYDHGDRTDRNKARLRFVVQKLGQEKFIELFRQYFKDTVAKVKLPEVNDFKAEFKKLEKFDTSEPKNTHYQEWVKYAVSATKFGKDFNTLRLFVPYGNLEIDQIKEMANLADQCGVSSVRLTQSQDILFPVIHKSALPTVFNFLEKKLPTLDLTVKSFKGHIISCIGAKVCKIGIADSSVLSDELAAALDEYFAEHPEKKAEAILPILRDLKISGCPNTCSGHAVCKIGLQGMKKKQGDVLKEGASVFIGGFACRNEVALAEMDQKFVLKENLGKFLENLILENRRI